jgi:plasmid stabilization system protein ParE
MKLRVEIAPQARRDLDSILTWYRSNIGARSALKVAQTIAGKLRAIEAGRVRGGELRASRYLRVVAKKHVIIMQRNGDVIYVARIVHGAQDLEQVVANLSEDQR